MAVEEAHPHIPLFSSSPFARDGWVLTAVNSGTSLSNFDIVKVGLQFISSLSNSTRASITKEISSTLPKGRAVTQP